MASGAKPSSLTIDDAFEVLAKLGASQLESLILVGGQAAAFWIAKYEIADPRRVTTKDIDVFLSEPRPGVAVECAKDLSGELIVVKEPRAPDVARVRFRAGGTELQIDFLRSLHGISSADLVSTKLGIVDDRASGKILYVMHPVLALTSRLLNTFELPGRLTEENLSRLRFSVEAVRAYLTDQLSSDADARQDVLPSIERVYRLTLHRTGLTAWLYYAIDLLRGIPASSHLTGCPPEFLEQRYPQMLRMVERKRSAGSKRHGTRRNPSRTKK
ncbi:MAG TPA: hypothetical protein VGR40_10130 [Candidatus Binatus sp.]|nr:hypothetical protein [Candidatus Binatus sp.]